MAVVSTMILRSLRLTGEKIRGGSLTASEQTECLAELNSMLDSWSNERLMIFTLSQTSFALTASTGTYTIGSGADFNMTRPTKLMDPCFTRDTDDTDMPLKIIDAPTYGTIIDKTLGFTTPQYIFYDYGYSATSTATIRLYPLPDTGLTLFINTLQPLQAFSTMTHTVLFPPGYQRAIEYNYAVEASGGFTNVDPSVAMIARQSKAAIKSVNLPQPVSRLDYGIAGGMKSSILTGP